MLYPRIVDCFSVPESKPMCCVRLIVYFILLNSRLEINKQVLYHRCFVRDCIVRLYRMHEMWTIVTDDPVAWVCLSVTCLCCAKTAEGIEVLPVLGLEGALCRGTGSGRESEGVLPVEPCVIKYGCSDSFTFARWQHHIRCGQRQITLAFCYYQ